MCIYQPYTYLIGWKQYNKYYYGVRFGNKCFPEDDLWIKYFTSSKYVKEFRLLHGEPDIIQIRKKFNNYTNAICWEEKVLTRLNVLSNNKWLNQNIRGAISPMIGTTHPRFGKETPQNTKDKISNKNKGRTAWNKGIPRTTETIEKIRNTIGDSRKGNNNSMYSKKHSLESIEKIKYKAKNKGKNNPMYRRKHSEVTRKILSQKNSKENSNQFIGYYITPWGKYPTAKDAAINSPVPITDWTINRWCRKDNQKFISKISVIKTKILNETDIGKTFNEIGFSFQPRNALT